MDPLQELRLRSVELELAYTHFNAAKALRPKGPALEVLEFGGLRTLRDPGRAEDGDYNRVLGLRTPELGRLDEALRALVEVGARPRVDLDLCTPDPVVVSALRERGLAVVERQAFLARLATSGPGVTLTSRGRPRSSLRGVRRGRRARPGLRPPQGPRSRSTGTAARPAPGPVPGSAPGSSRPRRPVHP